MEYRKTGRGGAGNYYNQQDLEKAARQAAKAKTVEAQSDARPIPSTNAERKSSIAHAGRGGAGNVADNEALAKSTSQNANMTPGMKERRPSNIGYQGRGGAGNYKDDAADKAMKETRLASVNRKEQQESAKMINMTLKKPEQAHLVGQDGPT